MESFKQFLLNELVNVKPLETEAMLVLRKIIDMVDDGHVDYSDDKIKLNVGKLIKDKKYNNLNIIIKKGSGAPKLGRHNEQDMHVIFFYTSRLPKREKLDEFLSEQSRSDHFKKLFTRFYNDAVFDNSEDNVDSDYEKKNKLNSRTEFEKSYVELVNKLNAELGKYHSAKSDLDGKISKANHDLGHKEILGMSLGKIKKDMIGDTADEFKSKAIELYGRENYKLLDKEYRAKLDSRLSDYFEHKLK
jgi:hypothetical protein